mmetsp:Transcript_28038/g.96974  ORF Transcript_28038/g.96974 Transcript_28038/m.96974 type:complete len:565 (-) Transcript_28038:571-2265(-)
MLQARRAHCDGDGQRICAAQRRDGRRRERARHVRRRIVQRRARHHARHHPLAYSAAAADRRHERDEAAAACEGTRRAVGHGGRQRLRAARNDGRRNRLRRRDPVKRRGRVRARQARLVVARRRLQQHVLPAAAGRPRHCHAAPPSLLARPALDRARGPLAPRREQAVEVQHNAVDAAHCAAADRAEARGRHNVAVTGDAGPDGRRRRVRDEGGDERAACDRDAGELIVAVRRAQRRRKGDKAGRHVEAQQHGRTDRLARADGQGVHAVRVARGRQHGVALAGAHHPDGAVLRLARHRLREVHARASERRHPTRHAGRRVDARRPAVAAAKLRRAHPRPRALHVARHQQRRRELAAHGDAAARGHNAARARHVVSARATDLRHPRQRTAIRGVDSSDHDVAPALRAAAVQDVAPGCARHARQWEHRAAQPGERLDKVPGHEQRARVRSVGGRRHAAQEGVLRAHRIVDLPAALHVQAPSVGCQRHQPRVPARRRRGQQAPTTTPCVGAHRNLPRAREQHRHQPPVRDGDARRPHVRRRHDRRHPHQRTRGGVEPRAEGRDVGAAG